LPNDPDIGPVDLMRATTLRHTPESPRCADGLDGQLPNEPGAAITFDMASAMVMIFVMDALTGNGIGRPGRRRRTPGSWPVAFISSRQPGDCARSCRTVRALTTNSSACTTPAGSYSPPCAGVAAAVEPLAFLLNAEVAAAG
jgi:hypothetical protein